jgi:hypothetical protein
MQTINNINIFEHFTPVIFPPGHMGSFLLNFLSPNKNSYFNESGIKGNPIDPNDNRANYEWKWNDPAGYFVERKSKINGVDIDFSRIYQNYQNYPNVNQQDQIILITIMNMYWAHYNSFKYEKDFKIFKWNQDLTNSIMENLDSDWTQMPLDFLSVYWAPYLKFHTSISKRSNHILAYNKFKSKKVLCRFNFEKFWLADILLHYKKKTYFTKNNIDISNNDQLKKMQNNTAVMIRNKFMFNTYFFNNGLADEINDIISKSNFKDEYIDFDMYNLVFNKNIDQIYEIDPTFEFTDAKKRMLDYANQTSIQICEYYDVDHNFSINSQTTSKEILAMGKLSQLIDHHGVLDV